MPEDENEPIDIEPVELPEPPSGGTVRFAQRYSLFAIEFFANMAVKRTTQ